VPYRNKKEKKPSKALSAKANNSKSVLPAQSSSSWSSSITIQVTKTGGKSAKVANGPKKKRLQWNNEMIDELLRLRLME
jgi:hypothetical protein